MNSTWACLAFPLAFYVLGFVLFPPIAITNTDEAAYVRQAVAFANGEIQVDALDGLTCQAVRLPPSVYPAATSALQSHLVRAGGWLSAAWLSVGALVVAVGVLGSWLRAEGLSPSFALLFLVFPPTLVLARTATSDVPFAAFATIGLALTFRGSGERPWLWLAAGMIGGLSLMFRDVGPLFFFALFAAIVLRRERGAWLLVLGGVLGLAATALSNLTVFGEVLRVRGTPYRWTLPAFVAQAPYYFTVLLVTVPGSLLAVAWYRGRRRFELIATVIVVFLFFSAYEFGGRDSGVVKQLVIGPRFFLPLMPLLVLAIAESASRIAWPLWTKAAPIAASVVAAALAFGVHPILHRWGAVHGRIAEVLYSNTPARSAIVTNETATRKYFSEVLGVRAISNRVTRELVDSFPAAFAGNGPQERKNVLPGAVADLVDSCPRVTLALLDRTDSETWRADAAVNAAFVTELERTCRVEPIVDLRASRTERLRLWRVGPCPTKP